MANSPQILLLDEPTGDLDTLSTIEVMNLLLSINNFGYSEENQSRITMMMVTHNPDIECYVDRILYVKDGKLIKQVLNEIQFPLNYAKYIKYINAVNQETE